MKPRQNIYLDEDLCKHLDTLAAKPGSSKSAIVRDALTTYLARRGAKDLQDTFSKRLDEISNQLNTIERQQRILIESLALFVRFQLGIVPSLPETEQAAAHALGTKRYQAFISQVSRILASGKNTGAEILGLLNEEMAARAGANTKVAN